MKTEIILLVPDATKKRLSKTVSQFMVADNAGTNAAADGTGAWTTTAIGTVLWAHATYRDGRVVDFVVGGNTTYNFKDPVQVEFYIAATDPITGAANGPAGKLSWRIAATWCGDDEISSLSV